MPTSRQTEILARVLVWAETSVRDRVVRKAELEFDVPLLITELAELDVCSLLDALAKDFDEPTLHNFFAYVLAEDPSIARSGGVRMERLFEEQPFPRYVVALLYLAVMDCHDHDFRALAGPIWSNVLAARHLFWPELLTEMLLRVEPKEVLLERALLLSSSEVEHERFLGENLLYDLPVGRTVLRQRLKGASQGEADPVKARRYKELYKRYRWS
ncbi:MAG TPA: hypothetical protein VF756_23470 [Thermoanaerobaculia bacterium]